MSGIITAVTSIFNWFFVGNPSANPAVEPAIKTVVSLVVNNDYLLVGLALMITGAAVSYLARLIHNT